MKAENTTTPHNRTIRITEIPEKNMPEMLITIEYVDNPEDGNRIHKAITLDHIVIPAIIAALNKQS